MPHPLRTGFPEHVAFAFWSRAFAGCRHHENLVILCTARRSRRTLHTEWCADRLRQQGPSHRDVYPIGATARDFLWKKWMSSPSPPSLRIKPTQTKQLMPKRKRAGNFHPICYP